MFSRSSKLIKDLRSLPTLFWVSGVFVLILFIFGTLFPGKFMEALSLVNQAIFEKFGNFYLWFIFVTFLIFLAIGFSPLGKIRLGGNDAKPTHSYFSWFSMIFCCGMGIGIMFWGAAEPLFHFMNPPLEGLTGTMDKHVNALQVAFFHWGVSPWAIYGLTTVAIAFWGYNLKKGFYLSSILGVDKENKNQDDSNRGLIYNLKKQILKPTVDLITLMAILFGVAASFGLGVLHLEGGLQNVFGAESSTGLKIGIIVFITVAYMISSMRGLDKGIKIISNVSIILSLILLISVFFLSPVISIIKPLIMGIPNYLRNVPFLSLGMAEYTSANWVKDWTLMYWSWWIAWTPFVSTFVALISKGRTIREVMYGVLVGPTLFILVWFVVFGDAAITLQIKQAFFGANLDLDKVNLVFFQMLNKLAGSQILSILSIVLIAAFFINSADSATYTLASLSNEDLEHAPPKVLQFGWGLMFTVLATLFLLTGGIHALIKVTLISVLPFGIWLVFVFYALIVKLISYYKEEFLTDGEPIPQPIRTKLKIKTTVVSPIYSPIRSTYGIDYK